jgi:predicted anti-sigma-YlaC factor YlaD
MPPWPPAGLPAAVLYTLVCVLTCTLGAGCATVKRTAVNQAGNALSGSGTTFASDDDPEFIRLAAPFSLKMMETLLAENPRHQRLLQAAASGFTQYAWAFIQQDGDALEAEDFDAAMVQWNRAQAMFLRARDYGLRGLDVSYPGFAAALQADPVGAAAGVRRDHVPLLYWTACAWGGAISLGKDEPELIGDLPQVEALVDRALALDPDYESGAIHQFLIAFEGVRVGADGNPADRARRHFERAVALSEGRLASPFVSLAETVSVKQQNRAEFEALLARALAIDVDERPAWRLANSLMQQRARRLLARIDEQFLPIDTTTTREEMEP